MKAGEGFFAIYPRTNAPRINLFADPEEELYQYSGMMALLRVQNDYLAMHCGRLLYSVAFHEARPVVMLNEISASSLPVIKKKLFDRETASCSPCDATLSLGSFQEQVSLSGHLEKLPDTECASPRPWSPGPVWNSEPHPDAEIDLTSEMLPSSPSSESPAVQPEDKTPDSNSLALFSHDDTPSQSHPPFPYTHVSESLLRRASASLSFSPTYAHVSHPGDEIISVTVHGATSLPLLRDGGTPLPFAILCSGVDGRQRSQAVTQCPLQPTHNPCWEETLSVELLDVEAHREDVVINVGHGPSKELLAHYRLPSASLKPFQHYHLELVQVLLWSMDSPLKDPVGALLAVARVVADYDSYRDSMLLCEPRAAGVCVMSVPFPRPSESALTVPSLSGQGQPQISPPGSPEQQPVWNHCFLFLGRDCATAFTPGAALVLEYYSIATVMNAVSWHMKSPVAFSALSLDQQLYSSLMSEWGQRGLRLQGLQLQGCSFQTISHASASVSIVLRLIGSEHPDSILSQEDCSQLPCVEAQLQGQRLFPAAEGEIEAPHSAVELELELEKTDGGHSPPLSEHHTLQQPTLQKDGYDLPSYDALAQILPEYQHLLKKPKAPQESRGEPGEQKKSQKSSQLNQTFEILSPREGLPVSNVQDNDPHVAEITEHQTKEVENYRTAMCKMAEDILALRSQIASLEAENSQLRTELSLHQDLGRTLLDDTDIDVMTKTEITDRIISLKVKLASESSKAAEQREKIQRLQNDLIRKNDSEKELVRLQQAHQQQQAVLQRYQERIRKFAGLEATVHQQEKVIERMEKLLDTKLRERNKENTQRKKAVLKHKDEEESKRKEIESVIAAENTRLREELERLRHQPPAVIIQQPAQLQQPFSDSEKLRLLGQLERAEAYIHTLEKQLEENARQWGKEKQEMLIRLSEYDHGFTRTSTLILHDRPPKDVSDPVLRHIRHKRPDPLK
ncbi:coiled-coil domain-containing protein 33 isoform X2 [Colossoma macropomum]|uniref:coiled-coil domain-containing protein 33 isoform X2 n=1 Tax=Colossoma macropomum TaxID=42526 RepID=UPI001864B155|nr:coiled-coil domain-containing protein 33 isoform X2 [Colossoma macropomum]